MDNAVFTVRDNACIARDVYCMTLEGDVRAITAPGQFVNIKLDGFFLRRPISVCDYAPGSLTLIYKAVGEGTRALRQCGPGTQLDLLIGLGNGYDTAPAGDNPLLLGGGVGVPPL